MGWIVDGVQSALIVKQIVAAGWCDERQARRMLTTARERWTEGPEVEIKQKRQLKIAELQQLKRTLKADYKGTPSAIRAIMEVEKQIIMLEGLNAPQRHVIQGDKDKPLEMKSGLDVTKLETSVLEALVNASRKN